MTYVEKSNSGQNTINAMRSLPSEPGTKDWGVHVPGDQRSLCRRAGA